MSIPTKPSALPTLDAPEYFITGRTGDDRYGKIAYGSLPGIDEAVAATLAARDEAVAAAASINIRQVADTMALAALDVSQWLAAVTADGAQYLFDASDLSAEITAGDPRYVAPASDPTGASGAWVLDPATPFNTVSDMLASYQRPRGVGAIWDAGGFRYEEAASGATDQHVTTAGGVKLYVLPGKLGFDILAFGADLTGVSDASPIMVKAARAAAGAPVIFPAGTYRASTVADFDTAPNFQGQGKIIIEVEWGLRGTAIGDVRFSGMQFEAADINGLRFRDVASFNADGAVFDGVRVAVIPVNFAVTDPFDLPVGPVSLRNSSFTGTGTGDPLTDTFVYVASAKSVDLRGASFAGTGMYEFVKTAGYTGPVYWGQNVITGDCLEEVFDCFTTYGPVYFEDIYFNMNAGGLFLSKSDGGAGPHPTTSYPKYMKIDRISGHCASFTPFYIGGARGMVWSDGVPQRVDIGAITLTSADDTSGSSRRFIDVRGIDFVNINGVTGGWEGDYVAFQWGVHIVGCGRVCIVDSPILRGSIVVTTGNTSNGTPYGGTDTLAVARSGIRGALGPGMVTVQAGAENADLNLIVEHNKGFVDHAFPSAVTRPVYLFQTIKSLYLTGNGLEVLGSYGNVNPILGTQDNYTSFGNDWEPKTVYGTAAPTTGTWARGSKVLLSNPSNGGTEGFICTAAGTPGTWKSFGTIAA